MAVELAGGSIQDRSFGSVSLLKEEEQKKTTCCTRGMLIGEK